MENPWKTMEKPLGRWFGLKCIHQYTLPTPLMFFRSFPKALAAHFFYHGWCHFSSAWNAAVGEPLCRKQTHRVAPWSWIWVCNSCTYLNHDEPSISFLCTTVAMMAYEYIGFWGNRAQEFHGSLDTAPQAFMMSSWWRHVCWGIFWDSIIYGHAHTVLHIWNIPRVFGHYPPIVDHHNMI